MLRALIQIYSKLIATSYIPSPVFYDPSKPVNFWEVNTERRREIGILESERDTYSRYTDPSTILQVSFSGGNKLFFGDEHSLDLRFVNAKTVSHITDTIKWLEIATCGHFVKRLSIAFVET